MADPQQQLLSYEALELRAEYDARMKTLKDCLPEGQQPRDRFAFARADESRSRPSPEFDVAAAREQLRKLETKRRKLNSAIQQVNFQHQIEIGGETVTLNEALELRKGLNTQIGELHTQVVKAAYQRVIYKEDRDIVEPTDLSYTQSVQMLDETRVAFREVNRKIRAAAYAIRVAFRDEQE
jgi:hypothetical protein